MNNLTAKW